MTVVENRFFREKFFWNGKKIVFFVKNSSGMNPQSEKQFDPGSGFDDR
jgi:hypothetical protein